MGSVFVVRTAYNILIYILLINIPEFSIYLFFNLMMTIHFFFLSIKTNVIKYPPKLKLFKKKKPQNFKHCVYVCTNITND